MYRAQQVCLAGLGRETPLKRLASTTTREDPDEAWSLLRYTQDFTFSQTRKPQFLLSGDVTTFRFFFAKIVGFDRFSHW